MQRPQPGGLGEGRGGEKSLRGPQTAPARWPHWKNDRVQAEHSRVMDSRGSSGIREVSGLPWSLLGRGGCDGAGSRRGLGFVVGT